MYWKVSVGLKCLRTSKIDFFSRPCRYICQGKLFRYSICLRSFILFWMFEILSTCCSYSFTDHRECLILSLFYIGALSRQDVESYIVKFDFVPLNSLII